MMNPSNTLVLATFNQDKIDDFHVYLAPYAACLAPLSSWTTVDVEETGTTFEENALMKARYGFKVTGHPSMADDSGLCMRSLGGLPGIYAGRFAMMPDGSKNFKYAFQKLEDMLGDNDPVTDFVCAIAYVDHEKEYVTRGIVPGIFDFTKRDVNGFGYTPIFVPSDDNPQKLSLAEMGDDMRRIYSARKKAVDQFIKDILEKF